MATYLVQVSYTAESLSSLIAKPQDRSGHISKVIAGLGGKSVGSWLAFGDYDSVMVVEMPNNVSAAALALAAAAGGSCKSVKTTPLLTIAQGLSALRKAGRSGYKPIAAAK